MKKSWRIRFAAMLMTAALFLSAHAEQQPSENFDKEPEHQIAYENTEVCNNKTEVCEENIPEETEVPENQEELQETPAPEATDIPVTTNEPEITVTPEVTYEPEITVSPEATDLPEIMASPVPTDAPQSSATPEPTPTPEVCPTTEPSISPEPTKETAPRIVAFALLEVGERTVSEKPDYETVLAALPSELTAVLSDGNAVQVEVMWSCGDYDADSVAYVFVPSLMEEDYALDEGVKLPTATLYVVKSDEIVYGDFVFVTENDDGQTLVGFASDEHRVSVPAEVDGKNVAAIAASAFAENDKLREILIPVGVRYIESGAFLGCSSLEKIILPDTLERVGDDIFEGCGRLESVLLRVSGKTVIERMLGYTREIVEWIDDQEIRRSVSLTLDRPFTDINVLDGGCLSVEGPILIEKDHACRVDGGGSIRITADFVVLGSFACSGECINGGKIIACGGDISGIGGNVVTDHDWLDGCCSVCGARKTVLLDVDVLRERFEKTYDGTFDFDIGADDFRLTGILEGDDVFIAGINADFDGTEVGNYLTNVEFVLGGEHARYYEVKKVEIGVSVLPKKVTVSPRDGQGKTFGETDLVLSAGYRGTVNGEVLYGALSREKGEAVGRYRILPGTLERLNPNYEIVLTETYFEIAAKQISDDSVIVESLSNERYTGSALEPSVEIHDGSKILKEGQDYTLWYTDNVSVGTAVVTIDGIGNYTGSREVMFRIIKVNSGAETSGLGGSSTSSSTLDALNDFGSDTPEEAAEAVGTYVLTVSGSEIGAVLFDEFDQPCSFVLSERLLEDEETIYHFLTVEALEALDEFGLPLTGVYGHLCFRLDMDAVRRIADAGYTHIEWIVGEAEVRIPLNTLYAEFIGADGSMIVEAYEASLWPLSDEEFSEDQRLALDERLLCMQPVYFGLTALPQSTDEEAIEPVDVLNILEGVQLMLVPEAVPDYENAAYENLFMDITKDELHINSENAAFVLDGERIKSMVSPVCGGIHALAEAE